MTSMINRMCTLFSELNGIYLNALRTKKDDSSAVGSQEE